jgi:hypothetical protein
VQLYFRAVDLRKIAGGASRSFDGNGNAKAAGDLGALAGRRAANLSFKAVCEKPLGKPVGFSMDRSAAVGATLAGSVH